jgi:putative heme iron utilization protein
VTSLISSRYVVKSRCAGALEIHPAAAQNAVMNKDLTLKALQQEAIEFRRAHEAVMLSTVSAEAEPDASYAPCILDEQGRCYILISLLAQHTRNLCAQPQASLMWLDDAQSSRNAFARRRLVLQCTAENIERDSDTWNRRLAQMAQQLGNTVELLASLPDFKLFRFDAVAGNYIRGFAQAYPVSGNALVMAVSRTR